jgi:hypothetical protein
MSELDVRKDFICTTTENTNQYGSRRIADTNYSSNLSKEFVSKLSVKNTASNLTIYIGRLNGILISICYIKKKDLYEKHADLVLEKGWKYTTNCMKQSFPFCTYCRDSEICNSSRNSAPRAIS